MLNWLAVDKVPGPDTLRMEAASRLLTPNPRGPKRFQGAQMQSPLSSLQQVSPLLTWQARLHPNCLCITPTLSRACEAPTIIPSITDIPYRTRHTSHTGEDWPREELRLTPGHINIRDLRTPDSSSSAPAPRLWAQWEQQPQHSCSLQGLQHPTHRPGLQKFLSDFCGERQCVTYFLYPAQRTLYRVGP